MSLGKWIKVCIAVTVMPSILETVVLFLITKLKPNKKVGVHLFSILSIIHLSKLTVI